MWSLVSDSSRRAARRDSVYRSSFAASSPLRSRVSVAFASTGDFSTGCHSARATLTACSAWNAASGVNLFVSPLAILYTPASAAALAVRSSTGTSLDRSCRNQALPRAVNAIPGSLVGSRALKLTFRAFAGLQRLVRPGIYVHDVDTWRTRSLGRIRRYIPPGDRLR
jgi:hypothetical protein